MADVDGKVSLVRVEDEQATCLKDITAVRITAIVKSDDRVTYEAERDDSAGSSLTITKTVRKNTFRWVKRHSSSAYGEEGTGVLRDDGTTDGPMEELASRLRKDGEPLTTAVSFTIPWVEFTYRVGDRVNGLTGRDIELRALGGDEASYPIVEEVSYDFDAQETSLGLRTS